MKAELDYKERKELAWNLVKKIEIKYPDITMFADAQSFEGYFLELEEQLKVWVLAKKNSYDEGSFTEELEEEFKMLEKEVKEKFKIWKQTKPQRNFGAIGLPEDFHITHQVERQTYLHVLFKNSLTIGFLSKMFSSSINNLQKKEAFIHQIVDTKITNFKTNQSWEWEAMPNQEKANRYVKILRERIAPYELEGFEFGVVSHYFYYPERMEISSFLVAQEWAQNIKNELGLFEEPVRVIILNTLADSLNESTYNTAHKLLSRALRQIASPVETQEATKPAPQAFGPELDEELVKKVLVEKGILEGKNFFATNGDYIGEKTKGKPLFDALKEQGFFKSKSSRTKQTKDFSNLLKKISFHVTYKTIGKEFRTDEQKEDFEQFLSIIEKFEKK